MLLKMASLLVLLGLPRVRALPVIHLRALGTRENTGGNKPSVQIIVPVVLAVVFFMGLLVAGWWRRRRRMRQAVTDIRNNSSTTNTATPAASVNTRTPITAPGTGPDAPPRPPRRRRRRRPSQISTKSLPAYNEQAGDEEIVLVRRTERDSMSDDDDYDDNPRNEQDSTHENSRSFDATPLLDDTSPEMGQISLASSTRGRSIGDHDEQDSQQHPARLDPSSDTSTLVSTTEDVTNVTTVPPPNTEGTSATNTPLGDAPPYVEAIHSNDGEAGATQETASSEIGQSSQALAGSAATPTSAPDNAAEADTFGTLRPKRKSVFRQFFALNKPGSTSTPLSDSVELAPTAPRQSLSAASATQGASRHRPSNSISTLASTAASGRGHALSPSLSSLLLTRSRSPTRSSDSLAHRLTISAPIPTTLVRTELSYPRSGPTPEQIRFLSSRESLGRFGMPYGEEAVAAAARSRENISSMVAPPQYEGLSTGNAASEAPTATLAPNSRMRLSTLSIVHSPTAESAPVSSLAEAPPPPQEDAGPAGNNEGSASPSLADQAASPVVSASGSAMPNSDRRDSILSANSFVTANEGDREGVAEGDEEDGSDTSPPTPTAETYRQAEQADTVRQPRPRGQTILIPESQSDDGHHPQLTFIPATPTVDAPARDGSAA